MKLNTLDRLALVGLVLCAMLAAQTRVAAQTAGRAVLVTPQWLAEHLDDAAVRIVDLGKTSEQYDAGHIPNARFVDWRSDLVDPERVAYFDAAPRDQIEALLSRLGIQPDHTIVLYDSQSSRLAARMFWILRYYGHGDIRILDGGAGAWEATGFAQSVVPADTAPTAYRFGPLRPSLRAERADVEAAIGNARVALVDARAPSFFTGEATGSRFQSDAPNARSGHIPGAENAFWAEHFNDDGTFKPVEELAARYAAQGIKAEQTVISYCHVGLQASTPWFVLSQLLGFPDVRLYDSSMAEWANTPGALLAMGSE